MRGAAVRLLRETAFQTAFLPRECCFGIFSAAFACRTNGNGFAAFLFTRSVLKLTIFRILSVYQANRLHNLMRNSTSALIFAAPAPF
ncbi:hypothetical protein HMPREF9123_2596 [Neisseria bacilliformis ATCC BAA-1200]|uniref:Uncharacterized protein n=1 Tax=Neisseria bacilliformis ATCC BAA-1200 TaxID=888742 RepID=F2BFT9_9NEIS|nr:hypothetical protein HMPREF9123_2596 [Neisseria bacilliformis ATCC BAA-1200]